MFPAGWRGRATLWTAAPNHLENYCEFACVRSRRADGPFARASALPEMGSGRWMGASRDRDRADAGASGAGAIRAGADRGVREWRTRDRAGFVTPDRRPHP